MRQRRTSLGYAVAIIAVIAVIAVIAGALLVGCSASVPGVPPYGHANGRIFTSQDWDALEADPNAYKGAMVSFVGRVAVPYGQAQTPPNIVVFANPKAISGVAVVVVAADPGVKAGQYVAIVGTVLGQYSGAGPFSGSDVKPVLIQAKSVEVTAGPASTGAVD